MYRIISYFALNNGCIIKDKKVFLVGLNDQPKNLMEKANIIPNLIPREQIFNDFESSILSIKSS